jgi:hypothetical protein
MSTERLEPWDELPENKLKQVNDVTDAIHKATDNMEYNLATDVIKVPGQNFACVSFVSPNTNQKCDFMGMKIRGVFDKHEEAVEYVKRLIKLDTTFDIFICSMYEWCLVPPDPEHISDQKYQDETLNTIISEYRKNQIYAKEHFEERKKMMVEQAADEVRRATLKKIQEESENELNESMEKLNNDELHNSAITDSRAVIDVTDLDCSEIGKETEITPSELMDQMVGGRCKE